MYLLCITNVKTRKTYEWTNLLQFEKLFKISRKLSKAYFVSANICRKKLDYPTEILGWKISLHEIGNDALNTLVHQSIKKHLTKEEKGMTLNVFRDSIFVKNYLGNELNLPDDYGKEGFNNA